jgi:hypothetical protein
MNQVKLTHVINLIKSILIYLILNYLNPSVYLFSDYALPIQKILVGMVLDVYEKCVKIKSFLI